MGFYPVTPGSTTYSIGSPLIGKATINLSDGKTFTIIANNNSVENMYIQSASLNGKPMNKTWIDHYEIVEGGNLVFEMGPEPNKQWGINYADVPPSMSRNN
jgi:putative alpha-1,2-mannosidase